MHRARVDVPALALGNLGLPELLPAQVRSDAVKNLQPRREVHACACACGRRRGRRRRRRGRGEVVRRRGVRVRVRRRRSASRGAEFDAIVAAVVVEPLAGLRGGQAKLHRGDARVEHELQRPERGEGRLQRLLLVHRRARGVELGGEKLPLLAVPGANHAPVQQQARLARVALQADGVHALRVGLDRGEDLRAVRERDGDEIGDVPEKRRARRDGDARVPRGAGRGGTADGAIAPAQGSSRSGVCSDPARPGGTGGGDGGSAAVEGCFFAFPSEEGARALAGRRESPDAGEPVARRSASQRSDTIPVDNSEKGQKDAPRGRAGDGTEGTESERHGGVGEPRTPLLRDLRVGNGEDAGRRVERAACCARERRDRHRKIYCIGFSCATTVLLGYERPFRPGVFRRRKSVERSPSTGRRGKP